MSLESAYKKLAAHKFPLEDLPTTRDDPIWTDIRKECDLALSELSSLKNTIGSSLSLGAGGVNPSLAGFTTIESSSLVETGEALGEGAFSKVRGGVWTHKRKGLDTPLKTAVAIKIPKGALPDDFWRDLRVMCDLPHQNILLVHGVVLGQIPRLVCERMELDLDTAIHKRKIVKTRQFVLRLARDIASGLEHLHRNHVVHRDVKPPNVLIRLPQLQIKLCDFGSSRDLNQTLQAMSLRGTLGYIAPEVLEHKAAGRSQDVWSFAVLLYECVTGERPSNTTRLSLEKFKSSPLCLEELASVFQACYQEDPKDRPAMSKVCADLEALLAQDGVDFDHMASALKIALAQDLELYNKVWGDKYAYHAIELLVHVASIAKTLKDPVAQPAQKPDDGRSGLQFLDDLANTSGDKMHQVLRGLVVGRHGEYQRADRKSTIRAQQKIDDEYKGDATKLLDLERATGLFPTPQDFDDCIADLMGSNKIKVVRMKDRLNVPLESGYRDVLLNIQDLQTGFVMELQLNFAAIALIKSQAHRLYELSRVMKLKLVYAPSIPELTFLEVTQQFLAGWAQCEESHGTQVLSVIRLPVAAHLQKQFQARLTGEMKCEWLWHGTAGLSCVNAQCKKSSCSLCGICATGFDPKRARTAGSSFQRFGHATYFAAESVASHNYNGQNIEVCGPRTRCVILSCAIISRPLDPFELQEAHSESANDGSYTGPLRPDYVAFAESAFLGRPKTQGERAIGLTGAASPYFDCVCINPRGCGGAYTHYVFHDPGWVLPMYLVTYRYAPKFAQSLPRAWQCRRPEDSTVCTFHRMKHLGKGNTCDHYSGHTSDFCTTEKGVVVGAGV